MDKFFHISERNSSLSTEIIGGFTTFLSMAYIIAVNPAILSEAGIPFTAALTATCIGAALATFLMGMIANRPVAAASGMGLNAIIAFGLVLSMGIDWRVAMSVVFIEGIVILILVLIGLREAIMEAIPISLQMAICISLGLFIAFIGLINGKVIVPNEATALSVGNFKDPFVLVALFSIAITSILYALNVKGEILWGIILSVLIGIPLGVTPMPTFDTFGLDFSTFAAPFHQTPDGNEIALIQALTSPALLLFAFSFLMTDFFDTMGGVVAIAKQAQFTKKDGSIENLKEILLVDSASAALGGFLGASSITTFLESCTGASTGARTGLASIVTALLFLVAAFLAPFVSIVTGAATCGALVIVGYLMMSNISDIEWENIQVALPSFLIIIGVPFTYSISTGIGLGFISYVIMSIVLGKAKDIKPLMWISAFAFLLYFIFT